MGSKLGENKAPKKKALPAMNGDLRANRDLEPIRGRPDLGPEPGGALPPLGGSGAHPPLGGGGRLPPMANEDGDVGKGNVLSVKYKTTIQ